MALHCDDTCHLCGWVRYINQFIWHCCGWSWHRVLMWSWNQHHQDEKQEHCHFCEEQSWWTCFDYFLHTRVLYLPRLFAEFLSCCSMQDRDDYSSCFKFIINQPPWLLCNSIPWICLHISILGSSSMFTPSSLALALMGKHVLYAHIIKIE